MFEMNKTKIKKNQSGRITGAAIQTNRLDSYFSHRIIQQRFEDELHELSKERNNAQLNSDLNQFAASTEENKQEQTSNEQSITETRTLNEPIEKSKSQLIQEIEQLKEINASLVKENTKLHHDNKILKKMLNKSKSVVFQKCLENKSNPSEKEPKVLFQGFENKFDKNQINTLRSIGQGMRKDSQFVSNCFGFLYKNNVNIMAQKCVSLKHSKNKSEISPDKKLLIQQMLCERIKSEQDTETNQFKRRERFGKLLSNAIYDNNRKAKNAAKSTVSQCSEHISGATCSVQQLTQAYSAEPSVVESPQTPYQSSHISSMSTQYQSTPYESVPCQPPQIPYMSTPYQPPQVSTPYQLTPYNMPTATYPYNGDISMPNFHQNSSTQPNSAQTGQYYSRTNGFTFY